MKIFIIIIVIVAVVIVPTAAMAFIGNASVRALGRNPTAAPKILLAMLLNLVFIEVLAIISLLVIFQLFGK